MTRRATITVGDMRLLVCIHQVCRLLGSLLRSVDFPDAQSNQFACKRPSLKHRNAQQRSQRISSSSNKACSRSSAIEAPSWSEIASHYPPAVGMEILDLMSWQLDSSSGRIVLWLTPPGTGKTIAIRPLAQGWKQQTSRTAPSSTPHAPKMGKQVRRPKRVSTRPNRARRNDAQPRWI